MKKIVVHRPGGYDRLCIEQGADLAPGPGEVLVEVKAIGVNYADCVTRMGLYASAKQYEGFPVTPGFEVAGHVAAVGAGVLPRTGGRPNRLRLLWDYVRTPRFSPFSLTTRNRSVLGFNLSFLFDRSDLMCAAMQQLIAWLEEDRIRPSAIHSYDFDQVARAHRDLESGQTVGKLILLT